MTETKNVTSRVVTGRTKGLARKRGQNVSKSTHFFGTLPTSFTLVQAPPDKPLAAKAARKAPAAKKPAAKKSTAKKPAAKKATTRKDLQEKDLLELQRSGRRIDTSQAVGYHGL